MAKDSFEKEANQKKLISTKLDASQAVLKEKNLHLSELEQAFHHASVEPNRIMKRNEATQNAVNSMKVDLKNVHKEIVKVEEETVRQTERRQNAEALRKSLDEKAEAHAEALEEKEKDVLTVRSALETEQSSNNDFVTRKIELNLRKKESENLLRISLDEQNTSRKTYEVLKRQLKNKRVIADEAKQAIPTLESTLLDEHISVKVFRDEQSKLKSEFKQRRLEIDTLIIDLLQQEGMEQSKKSVLFYTICIVYWHTLL